METLETAKLWVRDLTLSLVFEFIQLSYFC